MGAVMPGRTILVIDYDPESIESTRKSLLDAGYRVEVAKDGVEGLKAFERVRPDLVLIEPMVPRKHGFQVCQEIKGSPHGRAVPVVITTAFYKGRKHKSSAREQYGCDDYLEKPIAQDDLLAACRRWVGDSAAVPAPAPAGAAPSDFAALDDLSDDEIVARLDAMIDAVTAPEGSEVVAPPSAAVEPSAAVGQPEGARRTPSPTPMPTARESPRHKPPGVRAHPADRTTSNAGRPARATRATVPPTPRIRTTEAAVLGSGTTRSIVTSTAPAPRSGGGAPKFVRTAPALVAVVLLIGAAGLAWMLVERSASRTAAGRGAARPKLATSALPVNGRSEPARALVTALPEEPQASSPLAIREETQPDVAPEPAAVPVVTEQAVPRREGSAVGRGPVPTQPVGEPPPTDHRVAPPSAADAPAAGRSADPVPAPGGSTLDPPHTESASPPAAPAVEESRGAASVRVERGDLVALAEVDQPPVPIRKSAPVYPVIARNLRQQGTVTLRVLVDETGDVERVEVVQGIDGRLLDEAALRAASDWRYRPATKHGVPVKVWIMENVVFRL